MNKEELKGKIGTVWPNAEEKEYLMNLIQKDIDAS